MNLYGYVGGNPVNFLDPSGLSMSNLEFPLPAKDESTITLFNPMDVGKGTGQFSNNPCPKTFVGMLNDVVIFGLAAEGVERAVRGEIVGGAVATEEMAAAAPTKAAATTGTEAGAAVAGAAEGPSTLYHYTSAEGMNGIVSSNELHTSTAAKSPRDVRYGNGQYLSDIPPGTKTPAQLSREFINNPFQGKKFSHYLK